MVRALIAGHVAMRPNGDVMQSSLSRIAAMHYSIYLPLAYAHLATVLPAFVIGTYLMLSRKGSPLHRALGKAYLVLMLVTGTITLFMPAAVGPKMLNHFGFIHLFSVLTVVSVPRAYFAARRHDVRSHRNNMIGLYVSGLIIAGSFAFMPGRLLHTWLLT
jgi:uncharacterized membrane protein